MALKDEIPMLLDYVQSQSSHLAHNQILFNIYEGDLMRYVLDDLKKQLSSQSYEQIQHRVAPINVLRRLCDKLSKIYAKPPQRYLEKKSDQDQELFDWYQNRYQINVNGGLSNEFFNLFKSTAIEPYVINRKPALRVLPSDRFVVYSSDNVDPTKPTHFIKIMGRVKREVPGQKKNAPVETEDLQVYYVYTKDEFLPVDSKGNVMTDVLARVGNPTGINPYGRLPFVYINRSKHNLTPLADTDTLRMTKIFPILLSDLNFAVMFQAFSIVYGIDVDDENIQMSPNAFWRFKSDPSQQSRAPQVGVIKPQVDIAQVVGFIMAQLSFWLQSRNIRPGQVGQVSPESFASGVSKLVDEMDTYEDRQKQVPYFVDAEQELWDLTMNHMHPTWVKMGAIDEPRLFTSGQTSKVDFPQQTPMQDRQKTIAEVKEELSLGLLLRQDALIRLNPEMTAEYAQEYLEDVQEENAVMVSGQPEDGAKHTHEMPGGGKTGPDVSDAEGHHHSTPKGNTSSDAYGDGHTHSMPDGTETGPPVEQGAADEKETA